MGSYSPARVPVQLSQFAEMVIRDRPIIPQFVDAVVNIDPILSRRWVGLLCVLPWCPGAQNPPSFDIKQAGMAAGQIRFVWPRFSSPMNLPWVAEADSPT
jgi:hypothetical protein